jgi:hypothetical protein
MRLFEIECCDRIHARNRHVCATREQFSGDEQIRACAQSCEQCAAACRQLVEAEKTSVSHDTGEGQSCVVVPPSVNQPAGWSEAELR